MARKKTAQELREEAKRLEQLARLQEERENANLGKLLRKAAENAGVDPLTVINELESKIKSTEASTGFPQEKNLLNEPSAESD